MLKNKKIIAVICFLIIVSLCTRFYFLFFGMPSLTHDEADFYYTGYTLAKTGQDQWGNSFFLTSGFLSAIPSTPVYLSGLFWKFFPDTSVIAARLPFALINSISPVLFFILIFVLSGNITISIFSFLIFNFSPWFMHLSATAGFDGVLVLFFALLSTLILLWKTKQTILKYVLFIFFSFLGFNSYMGFKTVFPFFLFIQLLLSQHFLYRQKLRFKTILRLSILSLFIFGIFFFLYLISPGSKQFVKRMTYESNIKKSQIEYDVWYANHAAEGHPILKRAFANKLLAGGKIVSSNYLKTFEPNIFFVSGDPQTIYGLRITGFFYAIDILFLLMGIIYALRWKQNPLLWIIAIITIGGIPAAVASGGFTLSLRGMLLIIPYSTLIGLGYYSVFQKKGIFRIAVSIIIIFNIISFLLLYQTRIKVMSSEAWRYSDMQVITFLSKYDKVDVFTPESFEFFLMHSFYNNVNPVLVTKQMLNLKSTYFSDKKFTVYDDCAKILQLTEPSYIAVDPNKCPKEITTSHFKKNTKLVKAFVSAEKDNRTMFLIYRFMAYPFLQQEKGI